MTQLVAIPDTALAVLWPQIGHLLAAIAEGSSGKYMTGDLIKAISVKDMQLWSAVTDDHEVLGIATTELLNFPRKKVCRFIGATGKEPTLWLPHMKEIEEGAKRIGCAANEIIARPGWEKLLAPLGYRKSHVMLEKELS